MIIIKKYEEKNDSIVTLTGIDSHFTILQKYAMSLQISVKTIFENYL